MHWGDTISALRIVQCIQKGAYHQCIGGMCAVHWEDIVSALGGGDIMNYVRGFISTLGVFRTLMMSPQNFPTALAHNISTLSSGHWKSGKETYRTISHVVLKYGNITAHFHNCDFDDVICKP